MLDDGTFKHYHGCLVSFLGDTPLSSLAGGVLVEHTGVAVHA